MLTNAARIGTSCTTADLREVLLLVLLLVLVLLATALALSAWGCTTFWVCIWMGRSTPVSESLKLRQQQQHVSAAACHSSSMSQQQHVTAAAGSMLSVCFCGPFHPQLCFAVFMY
jgi:hypothetical protein